MRFGTSFGLVALGTALLPAMLAAQSGKATPAKAPTASAAVEEYIRAAADSNLSRAAELIGTDKGRAAHINFPYLEQRMVITHAYLARARAKALSEVASGKADERIVSTEIARGACKVVIPVTAVKSKSDGWLVRDLDLDRVRSLLRPCPEDGTGNSGN